MSRARDVRGREAMVLLAEMQDGVVTRSQLRDLGVSRFVLNSELTEGRVRLERQAVRVVGAAAGERAKWRRALANSCPTAALDGVTALAVHGLSGFTDEVIHLGIPRGGAARSRIGVRVHVMRSWDPGVVVTLDGLRVVEANTATVRAALWASTDRAAATVIAMAVQQNIAGDDALRSAASMLPRNKRRHFIRATVDEVLGGSESIAELDFMKFCREMRLPVPDRQTVLRRPNGVSYLDAEWRAYGVSVEVDGAHHALPARALADCMKSNAVELRGGMLLRITPLGVRTRDPEFRQQLDQALRLGGWPGPTSVS